MECMYVAEGLASRLRRRVSSNKAGLTVIEVSISMMIVATFMLASAGAFTSSIKSTEFSRRTTSAAVFLETTMEDVSAQAYPNLLTLNGNQIFDVTDANDSNYRVDLTVFTVELNLIQVRAVVTDLQRGREVGRLSAQRSDR